MDEDGYQPQAELFPYAQAAAATSPSQEGDVISVDDFDVGCDSTRVRKCKNMLNANVGLTDLNAGRSAYLSGCLKLYKVLVEQIQRTEQPEQHLLARRIRQFYMVMKQSWIGTPTTEPVYVCRAFREWMREMVDAGKDELVKIVKR